MPETRTQDNVDATVTPTEFGLASDDWEYVRTEVRNTGDSEVTVSFEMERPEDTVLRAVNDDTAPAVADVDAVDYSIDLGGGAMWNGDFVLRYTGDTERTITATLRVTIDGVEYPVELEISCQP